MADVAAHDENHVPTLIGVSSADLTTITKIAVNPANNALKVDASFTPSGTSDVNLKEVNGVAVNVGTGTASTGTQRVAVASDSSIVVTQPTGTNLHMVMDSGTTAVTQATASNLNAQVVGEIAHDSADSGNPQKVGAKAIASLKTTTLVADADRTNNQSDLDGALLVRSQFPLGDLISERVSNTDGASTAFTNFAAVASTKSYVTAITVYNTSATAGYVDFRDGTGGSVLYTMPIPAGGGSVISSNIPLFKTSANTALAYDVSAALTTVYISISGFYSKV